MTHPIFAIARSGMDVEWQRVEIVAANLANVNTTRTPEGVPYTARSLVSGPKFSALVSHPAQGVQVLGVQESTVAPKRVQDPSHPHADTAGFVSYPNIDHVHEMTTMIGASRAYEANLAVFTTARSMFQRALELGAK